MQDGRRDSKLPPKAEGGPAAAVCYTLLMYVQAQAERMEPPISPGKGLGAAKGMRRGPSKIKNPPSQVRFKLDRE